MTPMQLRARQLRKNMTDAEKQLWRRLRGKQMYEYKFRRQCVMGSYIVDFVCYEAKLIIEVDGGQHAINETYDRQRDRWLTSRGFSVLRFWNNEVLNETDEVLAVIASELKT